MPLGVLPTNVYLAVPYSEKEDAKKLGAKFDWNKKMWYSLSNNYNLNELQEKWKINTEPVILTGEDRTYGGNELFIDLIPHTSWGRNARSCIHERDWDRVRNHVYNRVDNTCECCHNKTKHIEAHERWHYDYDTETQKLVRLVALCRDCHRVTHSGRLGADGDMEARRSAKEHLKKVRNFTDEDFTVHCKSTGGLYRKRNNIMWNLDLSLLSNNNIKLNNIKLIKQHADAVEWEEKMDIGRAERQVLAEMRQQTSALDRAFRERVREAEIESTNTAASWYKKRGRRYPN